MGVLLDPLRGNRIPGDGLLLYEYHYLDMNTYRYSIFTPIPRVLFDPSNPLHMKDFAKFVKYGGWTDGCRYLLEDPYGDIPSMIRAKIADHQIMKLLEKV